LPNKPSPADRNIPDYRLGAGYACLSAALLALQEPFSALAARRLPAADFIAFTQAALIASLPLLLARAEARRDFVALLKNWRLWPKLLVLLAVGLAGLALYDLGLSSAHPIITAAVLNLSPFWAAAVARIVSRHPLPRPPGLFFGCSALSFCGAMAIAWSQIDQSTARVFADVVESALHSHWIYAVPMPILFALSGTLIYRWFGAFEDSAAVAANFLVSALALIPACALAHAQSGARLSAEAAPAVVLLLIGTLASSAAGRVTYQIALSATQDDNGFVTMFFLAIPAMSALVSWPLSFWLPTLRFLPSAPFFAGLALVTAPLLVFAAVAARR
jgi:drug/metabolite transporter (DMT)-like permease